MPKLLVHKKKPNPPGKGGRKVQARSMPHSPFQKLIEAKRMELNLSTRELARLVAKRPGAKVDQSTMWVWLHNKNGYPHPKSFRPAHLAGIASVLHVKEDELREALDASRQIYTGREEPTPAAAMDALAVLEESVAAGKSVYVRREKILALIKLIRAGASAPPRPQL